MVRAPGPGVAAGPGAGVEGSPGDRDPLVSVVIPCRDDYGWIEEAIGSVFAQTWNRWELIVVDDGSDAVPGWFEEEIASRRRVRLLRRRRGGVSGARNAGIGAAGGQYVAFLDADDRWRPTKLEASLQPLVEDEEVVLVYTSFAMETPDGGTRERRKPTSFPDGEFVQRFYVEGEGILPSTAVVRTDAIRAIGGFDEDLEVAEDRDCWLRLARVGRVAFVDEPLTYKTSRPDSLGARGSYVLRYRYEKRVARKLAGEYPDLADLLGKRLARIRSSGGYRQLERGRWRSACVLFRAALRDDPRCGLAWAGLALVPAVVLFGGSVVTAARKARQRWRWWR